MSRMFALIVVMLFAAPLAADDKDWTGKAIRVKFNNTKLGSRRGAGLVRDGVALDSVKIYVVASDSGNVIELVGQKGHIFKSETEVVPDCELPRKGDPAPKNKKNLWPIGTRVLPKKDTSKIQFADRDADGKVVYLRLSAVTFQVRQDRGDGWVRIHDGHHEGWMIKDDLIATADAPAFFDKVVSDNPKNIWALYMRAVACDENGEFDNAIKAYTEYIRRKPLDPAAYIGRGDARSNKKEYDRAIEDYNTAIVLKPKDAIAYTNRGNAWKAKKEYDKAIADYTIAIKFDPKYRNVYILRGNTWAAKKEYDKAIADHTEAIRLDPKSILAYYNRATVWSERKEYKKAIADYSKAFELNPQNADVLHRLAWFYATCPDSSVRDGKKAVEAAKKAVKLSPSPFTRDTLAAAYAEAGEFEQAIAEQKKALEDKSLDKNDRKKMESRLELYRAKKPYRDE
jgi:tetratricopeptide (TPR) repeat protein